MEDRILTIDLSDIHLSEGELIRKQQKLRIIQKELLACSSCGKTASWKSHKKLWLVTKANLAAQSNNNQSISKFMLDIMLNPPYTWLIYLTSILDIWQVGIYSGTPIWSSRLNHVVQSVYVWPQRCNEMPSHKSAVINYCSTEPSIFCAQSV